MYYPGHTGVKGNERADRLADKTTVTNAMRLLRSEMLRSLRHYVRAQSRGYHHHTIGRLVGRGMEREGARRSSLKGRERIIVNQMNIKTVLKATFGKLLRDKVVRIWHLRIDTIERIDTIFNFFNLL